MSITDELRTEARGFGDYIYTSEKAHRLLAIADRIDAEHEETIQQVLMGGGGVPATDENMAEHGWYRALDADKQPIKFGDEVEHNGVVANVLGITFHGTTPPTVCIVRGDCWVEADELRHHHAPTVEDVLREFALKVAGEECMTMRTGVVEEYAKRLKLAESEDA